MTEHFSHVHWGFADGGELTARLCESRKESAAQVVERQKRERRLRAENAARRLRTDEGQA